MACGGYISSGGNENGMAKRQYPAKYLRRLEMMAAAWRGIISMKASAKMAAAASAAA
jgi:hypothetical protein